MRPTITRPARLVTGVATALLLGLAGCSDDSGTPDSSDAAAASTPPAPAATTTASPTSPPPPVPVTTEQPCPYLEQSYVEGTVGQMVSRVEVTTTEPPVTPLPSCTFYALDGEPAVVVSTEQHPSPVEAKTAALAKVGEAGNPAAVGDGGAVLAADGKTTCAVSKGAAVVVVTTNQEGSLEAEEIAATVTAAVP